MPSIVRVLAAIALLLLAAVPAAAQRTYPTVGGAPALGAVLACISDVTGLASPCGDAANPVNIAGSFSATLSGFNPTSVGTPITATTGGATGSLPAGTVVVATNVGTTNGAYCALGASVTTAWQYIAPNGGWFAFTVGGATQLSCITGASTTTVNLVGGSGLPTGTGGGGGGGSGGSTAGPVNGNGTVTINSSSTTCVGSTGGAGCLVIILGSSQNYARINVIGLTASGATLTPQVSYDGTHIESAGLWQGATRFSTITIDGDYTYDAPAGAQFLRLLVTSTGTGNITTLYVSSNSGYWDYKAEIALQALLAGFSTGGQNVLAPTQWLLGGCEFTTSPTTITTGNGSPLACDNANNLLNDVMAWAGTPVGAPANYGTSPGAVKVPGVNAFVTNTPAVTCAACATAAKQPALGTAGSASADVITVQGVASMTPLGVSVASGGVASGAFASGSVASGAVASGAFASGSLASGAGTDGWNVTEGAKADAAWTSGSGSMVALLKAIVNAITAPIPGQAGTVIIGGVGIDQTTDGTTNAVHLKAGTALAGKFGLDQTTQGTTNGVTNGANTYNTVAASQSAQALTGGSGGATGDYLSHCVALPTSTSPGVVTILDNATTIFAFPGGASSLSNLVPFAIPIGAVSVSGAWKVTTGTGITVTCVGHFH